MNLEKPTCPAGQVQRLVRRCYPEPQSPTSSLAVGQCPRIPERRSPPLRCNVMLPSTASTSATRARRSGSSSFSNHEFRRSHMLLRGLGCGKGTMRGQYSRHDWTMLVTDAPASGRWYACAYQPTTSVSCRFRRCRNNSSRHAGAHSGRGGASPALPMPGKQKPIGRIATRFGS